MSPKPPTTGRSPKQNESDLFYKVMQELGKHGAVYRCNSGNVRLPNGKQFRGMPKGFSDVMLIRPGGKACFVEIKVRPNAPTPEQLVFIEKMQGLGCLAGVAYSIDEALKICEIEGNGGTKHDTL